MSDFTDYFKTEIASLNITASTLEARMNKGLMLLDREKDPTRRNTYEMQFHRLLQAYNRCEAAIMVLDGQRVMAKSENKPFCAQCLGLLHDKEVQEFFGDFESPVTGVGVPA